ncbi:MAG: glycoside hydrolase family 3 C-terminal domain-containing protein [Prevotella sp.]|jgi:beta-glucosidase|nr:glycoside hydrolase family 3 C-terminal domain-containing protein [Prevotella sp.]
MRKIMILALLCCASVTFAQKKAPQLTAKNIDQVIKAMTLEEKAQLLVGIEYDKQDPVLRAQIQGLEVGVAGQTHAIPRLGIPGTLMTDGPAGVRISPTREGDSRTFYATAFPIGTLMASSWDVENARKMGEAIGQETLDYGCDVLLAPGMNIHRNPLCGRNFEYFSEDPVLSGNISGYEILGVQSKGVGTSAKHFVTNNQETFRTQNNSIVGQKALREIYLKNFEIALRIGNPWTVMSSYNTLNGTRVMYKKSLLTDWLRGEMGFKGMVVTDWYGYRDPVEQEIGGSDLLQAGVKEQVDDIIKGVKEGKLLMEIVDRNVRHLLEYIVKTPHFRHYQAANQTDLKAHAQVSREAAEQGIILLKNDNSTLPIAQNQRVALFGQGSYKGFLAHGTGSGSVNKAYTINLMQGLENAGFTLEPELKSLYEDAENKVAISRSYAERRAKDADVAIVTIKRDAGEGADRLDEKGDWLLDDLEMNLLKNVSDAFHAQGKKVVVVLNIGGVIETASWSGLADAILLPWQPGIEGGNAVADILCGKVNPSGKLPMTFPVAYADIPSSKNFPSHFHKEAWDKDKKDIGWTKYDEGIWVGYRYFNTFNKPVAYPFGYGLSYTTFAYNDAKVKESKGEYLISVTIKNTGKVAGKEVAEAYISAPKGKTDKPARELKAFAKTRLLQPGESQVLTMRVKASDLASFEETSNSWITDAGTYKIGIGASVEDIRTSASFEVKKTTIQKVPTII